MLKEKTKTPSTMRTVEVCQYCRGIIYPARDFHIISRERGIAFCSEKCELAYEIEVGEKLD